MFDGLKSLVSSITNERNAIASNVISSNRLSYSEMNDIYKTGLGSRIVNIKTNYALNDSIVFEQPDDEKVFNKLIKNKVKRASNLMLAFGRGIIVIHPRGDDLSKPLGEVELSNTSLHVFGGQEVSVLGINDNLNSPRFRKPSFFIVNGVNIHFSRVVEFNYIMPSFYDIPEYLYGGISEYELINSQLINDGIVERASGSILEKSSTIFYKVKGFKDLLRSGNEKQLINYVREIEKMRSIYGAGIIDSEDGIESITQALNGLAEADSISKQRIAMVTGIPVAVFIGDVAKGLNATNDTEKELFGELISNFRDSYISDPLNELMLKLGLGGVYFKEGIQPTKKEKAEFEGLIIDNAIKLMGIGEDYEQYLIKNGVVKKDLLKFSDRFGAEDDE